MRGLARNKFFCPGMSSCLKQKLIKVEISSKKGRSSPPDFQPRDKVVIQDKVSKRWNIPGVITERHIAEDGTSRRFLVEKEDRFFKYAWKISR